MYISDLLESDRGLNCQGCAFHVILQQPAMLPSVNTVYVVVEHAAQFRSLYHDEYRTCATLSLLPSLGPKGK